jgi:hypothetical protein
VGLKTSEVYRCLEKKTLIFGFEMIDLFAVFLLLALSNFFFSGLRYKVLWTWAPALALALFLRLGKAGKPENYLLHWVRYQISPGVLSSFPLAQPRKRFVNLSRR